jgi:HEAT repeat protein
VDDTLIAALGGPPAHRVLSGHSRADSDMWKRVWATRGLLWTWDNRATQALALALSDESWRVREMAVRVVRRHLVGDLLSKVADMRDDPSARVRAVAESAVGQLVSARA